MTAPPATAPRTGLLGNPYLLLSLTVLFWSGNSVAGRLAVGHISPASLTCFRWLAVGCIMGLVSGRGVAQHWPTLRPRLGFVALMGIMGFTAYNALFYTAAVTTTAVNISIISASMPAMILIGGLVAFGNPVRGLQWLGMLVSLVGVLIVTAKGDLAALGGLTLALGDGLILLATALYAAYSLLLRKRPAVPSLVFFAATTPFAAASSLLLLGAESATGGFFWPTWQGWLILAYVAVFPSLLSQIFFVSGVEAIGPGRAGLFVNLMPLFGAVFAVLILGEAFALYHLAALVLVVGGILLAEWKRG